MDRYMIISADTHAGLTAEQYRGYLESTYHQAFDDFMRQRASRLAALKDRGLHNEEFAEEWFSEHEEGLRGGWDATRRDQELDADGVTGEVIFPDADAVAGQTSAPFGVGLGMSGALDPELAMAGARAHNRWLAELCTDSSERRRGVAVVPIAGDVGMAVTEIRRAYASGLRGGILIPAMWASHAPYHDPGYDPVWATCAELGLPVHTHSGAADAEQYNNIIGIYSMEYSWWASRPLWFLLWSGAFERFPDLRFVVTESGAWWVPDMLWRMDTVFDREHASKKLGSFGEQMHMRPSEYFDRNCLIGASNTRRREIRQRHEIGVGNLMWGNDFPHPEGTWPHTRTWLAHTFGDVPVGETRRMLGLTAAEVYGFDVAALRPLAERVGPSPAELGQPEQGNADGALPPVPVPQRHWLTETDVPAELIGVAS